MLCSRRLFALWLPVLFGLLAVGCEYEPGTATSVPSPAGRKVSTAPASETIRGRVVGVSDGDTLTVLDGTNTQHKIRLNGIDAPESGQPFGTQAKKALSSAVFGREILVKVRDRDRYGRIVGEIWLEESERFVNYELVRDGLAWHYKKYDTTELLADAETAAKSQRLGLWSTGREIPPWDWRGGMRETTDRNAAANGSIVYTTKSGSKYHRLGCRSLRKSSIPMSITQAKRSGLTECDRCRGLH